MWGGRGGGAKPDFTGSWTLAESDNLPAFLSEVGCSCVKVMVVGALINMDKFTEDCEVYPVDPRTGKFSFTVKTKMATVYAEMVPDAGEQVVKDTPFGDLRVTPTWGPLKAGTSGRPVTGGLCLTCTFIHEGTGKKIAFLRHLEVDRSTQQDLMVNEYFVDGRYVASKTYARQGEAMKKKKGGGCC